MSLVDINKIRSGKRLFGVSWKALGLTDEQVNDESNYVVMDDLEDFSVPSKIGVVESRAIEKTYYRYVGPRPERDFCKDLISASDGRFLTMEDIVSLNNSNSQFARKGQSAYSVFNWRGGKFCKHRWVKYNYNPETKELNRSFIQPRQDEVGGFN